MQASVAPVQGALTIPHRGRQFRVELVSPVPAFRIRTVPTIVEWAEAGIAPVEPHATDFRFVHMSITLDTSGAARLS
jgi:hypothetical protein